MLSQARFASVGELLAAHGIAGAPEEPLDHDGWSGAKLTRLRHSGRTYVLKRTSQAIDWIARVTSDTGLREARLAAAVASVDPLGPSSGPVVAPYLGVSLEGSEAAILMPDLSAVLLPWTEPIDRTVLGGVLTGMARLHAGCWPAEAVRRAPACPIDLRLLLLSEPASHRYVSEGMWNGSVYLPGWEAFRRLAPGAAVALVDDLAADPGPLIRALDNVPQAPLHGDLKLANAGLLDGGRLVLVDWQMLLEAPVAVELGWFLAVNVAILPVSTEEAWGLYVGAAEAEGLELGDVDAQADLAWIVGLLLRGWRKGADARDGLAHASGVSAADDLAWWSESAVAAARRRL